MTVFQDSDEKVLKASVLRSHFARFEKGHKFYYTFTMIPSDA